MAQTGRAISVTTGASLAVSLIINADVVGVGIAIVDIAATDTRRIMTAAVVVGVIVGDIWNYGQVEPWAAAGTTLDLDHMTPGAFPDLQDR
jgi:hypothetical protein